MSNISDIYDNDTAIFPVTALLFESDIEVAIRNNYRFSGPDSVTGNFNGTWVSEAGISMPRDSHFVTIAIPHGDLTVTQKLAVDWFNEETEKHGIVEYDLIVNIIT